MSESAPAAPSAPPAKKKQSLAKRLAKLALKIVVSGGLIFYFGHKLDQPSEGEKTLIAFREEAKKLAEVYDRPKYDDLARRLEETAAGLKASKRAADVAAAETMSRAAISLRANVDPTPRDAARGAARILAEHETGLAKFPAAFSNARWGWLAAAFVFPFFGFLFGSMRWSLLVQAQGVKVPLAKLYLSYFQATFFNIFLPGVYGGDVVRAYDSAKYTGKGAASVMVVIIERLIGGVALTLIASAAFMVLYFRQPDSPLVALWWVFALIFGVFVAVLVCSNPPVARWGLATFGRFLPAKVRAFAEQAYAAVEMYYRKPKYLAAALAVGALFEFNVTVYYYFILRGLGQDVTFVQCMTTIPVMVIMMMVIPTINGIGVRTWAFGSLMGRATGVALAAETVDLAMRVIMGLMGGLVFLARRAPQRVEAVSEAPGEAPAPSSSPPPPADGGDG